MDNPRNALSPGYKLHWYTIKKILGQGGFGITYLAEDNNLHQNVAIKEFLPIEMAVRDQSSSVHPVSGEYGAQFTWGLERFQKEAQTLAKFKHPNIVRVFSVFSENNTAYMVMEYEHGKAMDELLKNKKTLSEAKLKEIILPILDGLKQVHAAGFIHRDIKPANIFIRNDGTPVLLDFGSARQSFGEQTRTLTAMVSPGFAPFEQYVSKSDKQGPWTDIYGIAATMYRAIIGRSPAEAMDRSESLLDNEKDSIITASYIKPEGYSPTLLAAIDHGLAFKSENRPQSVSDWLAEIEGNVIPDQSEIETVIATENRDAAINDVENETDVEKTEVLKPQENSKKKPSIFKRLIKYTLIGFAILFVLAIISDENKQKDKTVATDETDKNREVQQDSTVNEITDVDVAPIIPEAEPAIDTTSEKITALLSQAEEDIQALRLTKPSGNNAVEKFQTILELDSANADAQKGLFNVATEYLNLTEKSIVDEKLDKASQYLNLAKEINSDHPDISSIENNLNDAIDAAKQKKQKIVDEAQQQELVMEPEQVEVKDSLISEQDRDKIKLLQARVKDNPRDRDARKDMQKIMKSYETKLKDTIEAGDYDTALAFIEEAKLIAPRSIRLKTLTKKIEQKKKEQANNLYQAGKLFRDELKNDLKAPEMIVIPAGSFQMGSKRGAREFFTGENPVHSVRIKNNFAMSTKEVSVAEFAAFVDNTDYQTEAEWQGGCGYFEDEWKVDPDRNWKNPGFSQSNNNPVVCVSWNDAIAMARWLSKETGFTYRLPTEAEWEYAARANKKGDTYWGSQSDSQCQYENLMDFNEKENKPFFQCTDGYIYTAPTGHFNANAFGLYDMLGNVLEFTMDCFNENYRGVPNDGSAMTKGNCGFKMLRGGAWPLPRGESNEKPTLTSRIPWVQNNRGYMIGFRLVRELEN